MDTLKDIAAKARKEMQLVTTADELEVWRVKYLGRKSALSSASKQMKDMTATQRVAYGKTLNETKQELEDIFSAKELEVSVAMHPIEQPLDVSLPFGRKAIGHQHIISTVQRRMAAIFNAMGFSVQEGFEAESEHYNFDALNIPAAHPARDMWDTFWLDNRVLSDASDKYLLRTHTSPMQVRYMEAHNPPLRIIVPGKCYRYEATDASHETQFHQLEGLLVDQHVSVANFKAILEEFFKRFFQKDLTIRLRPSYFPFTEPSFEVDIRCVKCGGKGCGVCKQTGWLEIMGAGMVHQNVFEFAGMVRGEWQGFAFGMGIERIAMLKYNIGDIRLFHSGDLRFIRQFR